MSQDNFSAGRRLSARFIPLQGSSASCLRCSGFPRNKDALFGTGVRFQMRQSSGSITTRTTILGIGWFFAGLRKVSLFWIRAPSATRGLISAACHTRYASSGRFYSAQSQDGDGGSVKTVERVGQKPNENKSLTKSCSRRLRRG